MADVTLANSSGRPPGPATAPPAPRRSGPVPVSSLAAPAVAGGELARLRGTVADLLEASTSAATRRAHEHDVAHFLDYCATHGLGGIPATPEAVALYIASLVASDRVRLSTIRRRLASLAVEHRAKGHLDSPTRSELVRLAMRGAARRLGTAPSRSAALRLGTLRVLLDATPQDTARATRDRAVLLLGFAGALRRSEIAALEVSDLRLEEEGLALTVRRSKTDQEGAGRVIGIPRGRHPDTCPVRAVQSWVTVSGITSGPLFRRITRTDHAGKKGISGQTVARIVKEAVARAGLTTTDQYSAHSLRSGFATEAAAHGVGERAIMQQTGHRSVQVLRGYIRRGGIWSENAAAAIGL